MKHFTKFVFALWIITVCTFGYFFIRGSTQKSTDNRLAVQLNESERDLILGEMRTILTAVNGILNSLAANDMTKASAAAKSAGMGMAVDVSPSLMTKLPLEFKNLGMSLHADFDALSSDIDKGLNQQKIIKRMGAITNKCLACHSTYKLNFSAK